MKTSAKVLAATIAAVVSVSAWAAAPSIETVNMTWNESRTEATISYTLANAPAVVTLDIIDGSDASIGGAYIGASVSGDVFRKVATDGAHEILWHPSTGDFKLPAGGVRAVVTAYPLDDTPDYMVVSAANHPAGSADLVRYYPGEDFLPGGLHKNREYKSSKIVMRRIRAKDVEWTMGSSSVEESAFDKWTLPVNESNHVVRLTNDYYLAVFETTHGQHLCLTGGIAPSVVDSANFLVSWTDRPVEQAYYLNLRGATQWPDAPAEGSALGVIRSRTGIDFDLPGEAQWEFACRAGLGEGVWNTGAAYSAQYAYYKEYNASGNNTYNGFHWWVGASIPGRCSTTEGRIAVNDNFYDVARVSIGTTNGTAIVGSYPASAWGLYDMHGNVSELTLDFYKEDISALNGAVCSDSSSGNRVIRGGSIESRGVIDCRAAARSTVGYTGTDNGDRWAYTVGYRLCCRNGLK